LLNRIKKEQDAVEAKTFAPNNKLYFWMLLGAIALTSLSLLVHECKTVFTIWTSITCGGIASIVVAWLIDTANCRQLNKKAVEHRKTLLSNLYHVFDNGLQFLILESAKKDHNTDSKKWYEWIETVDKQAMNDPALLLSFIRSLMVFFDDLAEQVFAVKSQETMLLESGIICQEDIQALSTILSMCDTARATYRSKDSNFKCFQQFSTYCGLIHGMVGYAPSLRPINDMMIEPTLYRKYLEVQEKTRTPEASQALPVSNPKQKGNETNE